MSNQLKLTVAEKAFLRRPVAPGVNNILIQADENPVFYRRMEVKGLGTIESDGTVFKLSTLGVNVRGKLIKGEQK